MQQSITDPKLEDCDETSEKTVTLLMHFNIYDDDNELVVVRDCDAVRKFIEDGILGDYDVKKCREYGDDYKLTVAYESDEQLNELIECLLDEIEGIAEANNCEISAEIQTADGEESWER